MIYVIGTARIKPESRDAYIKGAKDVMAATYKEKGCITYEFNANLRESNTFMVVERWETQADLDAHLSRRTSRLGANFPHR